MRRRVNVFTIRQLKVLRKVLSKNERLNDLHTRFVGVQNNQQIQRFIAFFLPMLVLTLGLLLTFEAQRSIEQQHRDLLVTDFEQDVNDLSARFTGILRRNEDLLNGVRGLYFASHQVTRVEFSQFISSLDLAERFPGALGVAWHPRVLGVNVERFEAKVARDKSMVSDGYPAFKIRPESASAERFPVTYFYPEYRAEPIMGVDFSFSQARLDPVLKARDSGQLWGSMPIKTIGVTDQSDTSGFMMALAVYYDGVPDTIELRRRYFQGVLSVSFNISKLLGEISQYGLDAMQIYDVTESEKTFLYRSGQLNPQGTRRIRSIEFANRVWEFHFYKGIKQISRWTFFLANNIVLVLGSLMSVLLALFAHVLMNSRNSALRRANELTADLQKANAELTRSNHDLGRFAHVASHDLQTPVRNVQSTILLLENALEEVDHPPVERYLTHLDKSAARMQSFVGDLLMYARAERMEPVFEIVDLNDVVYECLDKLDYMIEDTSTHVEVEHLPHIHADAEQLERLFSNLFSNAMKYRDKTRQLQLHVAVDLLPSTVAIRVADNGIGIEPQHQQRVFEPFKRLHRHDDIEGSGLGLSICKEIMNTHNAQLNLESQVGEGTTVTLVFQRLESVQQAA